MTHSGEEERGRKSIFLKPTIFLGVTSNLFATGVRECICFLLRHKLIDHVVVSGGAMEHDLRRLLEPSAYHLDHYAPHFPVREQPVGTSQSSWYCGNVMITRDDIKNPSRCTLVDVPERHTYETAMELLVRTISQEQYEILMSSSTRTSLDPQCDDVCTWSITPCQFWRRVGELLVPLLNLSISECDGSVLYWAAANQIPLFSPSFCDGDVVKTIRRLQQALSPRPLLIVQQDMTDISSQLPAGKSGDDTDSDTCCIHALVLDLVGDIHLLNRSAIRAKKSGMIILGGGVVKHHVCNANLMRNGADWSVFINNAQEYDGSDAGAKPEEAISWGKIRMDGQHVKVYSEVTMVFPLIFAQSFFKVFQMENSEKLLLTENEKVRNKHAKNVGFFS